RMALRSPTAFDPEPLIDGLRLGSARPERMTPARASVLATAEEHPVWTRSGLAHAAGVSTAVVDGLVKQGVFEPVRLPPPPAVATPDTAFGRARLSDAQAEVAGALARTVADGGFSTTLLEGVTGSGKTEVYFEAVAAALDAGRQVLILLPEIALTQAFIDRFHARFGAPPAEWHSDAPPRMREKVWRQAAEGRVRVVAGARSALFLPFDNLGLVIVDEEHDPAYKQEDRTFYHARDMAVVRASLEK
ncbi:MAG: DEAD/DEAH box helicase, partial [Mesorhizobium sp.]|nr:DEAD/DEAH box helicase [Mesorhizobium sp.]